MVMIMMQMLMTMLVSLMSTLYYICDSGGDTVRPYWDRYFLGAQGVIFVVDSSADEKTMDLTIQEFHKALDNNQLDGLPLLILANYQDVKGARSEQEVNLNLIALWGSEISHVILPPANRDLGCIGITLLISLSDNLSVCATPFILMIQY